MLQSVVDDVVVVERVDVACHCHVAAAAVKEYDHHHFQVIIAWP